MGDGRTATVQELWRFPVKSMQGERTDTAEVTSTGLAGDRAYAVVDSETGKVGSAKHPRLWGGLLQCAARYEAPPSADAPLPAVTIRLPDGGATGTLDPEVDRRLSELLGHPVRLTSVAPDGNAYQAVWPDIDGVIPDDYLRQIAASAGFRAGGVTTKYLNTLPYAAATVDVATTGLRGLRKSWRRGRAKRR